MFWTLDFEGAKLYWLKDRMMRHAQRSRRENPSAPNTARPDWILIQTAKWMDKRVAQDKTRLELDLSSLINLTNRSILFFFGGKFKSLKKVGKTRRLCAVTLLATLIWRAKNGNTKLMFWLTFEFEIIFANSVTVQNCRFWQTFSWLLLDFNARKKLKLDRYARVKVNWKVDIFNNSEGKEECRFSCHSHNSNCLQNHRCSTSWISIHDLLRNFRNSMKYENWWDKTFS